MSATESKTTEGAQKSVKKPVTKTTKVSKTLAFPYAVILTGGKQYRVSQGDMLLVEKIDAEPGATWTADEVLFVAKGPGDFAIGQPRVKGAKVTFEVLQQTLDKKVIIRHSRRRQSSQKTLGHRQPKTRLVVKEISQ